MLNHYLYKLIHVQIFINMAIPSFSHNVTNNTEKLAKNSVSYCNRDKIKTQ